MVSRTSKLVIINAVKHTEAHNKRWEENEMLNQRRKELEERKEKKERRRERREANKHYKSGGNLQCTGTSAKQSEQSQPATSNKWSAELLRFEESLGDERWGHGGYKELYPEEFRGDTRCSRDSSMSADEIARVRNRKRKKRHKSDNSSDDCSKDVEYGPEPPPLYVLTDSETDKHHKKSSSKKSKKHKHKKGKHKKVKRER